MSMKRVTLSLSAFLLLQVAAMSQQTAPQPAPQASSMNTTEMLMLTIALVLAFVIWGMGQVLFTLGHQVMDKRKNAGKMLGWGAVMLFSLLNLTAGAQDQAVAVTAASPAGYGDLNPGAFWAILSVLGIEVIAIFYMMYNIRLLQRELIPEKERAGSRLVEWWNDIDRRFFTRAVAVEKEADVMLDHDYDGIRELDNALPPWWKYGFYVSIVAAVVYLFYFHVIGTGLNPVEEYEEEMKKAELAIAAYNAKNADQVDENNLQMPDATGLAKGKDIFQNNCWACHGKAGEGGVGPNLTDDYWIHKGSLSDIYQSIKHGYPEKGMQAWEKQYSPKEINDLAGYIKTLKGTNPPNPKVPEGPLFIEGAATGMDSAAAITAKPDSVAVQVK